MPIKEEEEEEEIIDLRQRFTTLRRQKLCGVPNPVPITLLQN
jgi:hypothetical protein